MASSGRRPGALAQVPHLPGSLHCAWNRRGAFAVNRNLPADAAGGPVRDVVVVPCSKTSAPLWRIDIDNEKNSAS